MKLRNLLVAGFALVVLAACGNAESRGGGKDHLVIAQNGEPASLDPHAVNNALSAVVINQIMERLVRQDEDGNFHPWLAESWEPIDDVTYQFNLRQDVYFHNGEPLRASDVVFSLRRAANSPTSAPILGMLNPDAIIEVDDFTVHVATFEPFMPLIAHLAHTSGNILSQVAVETLGDEFGNAPIGTNAFMFESWSRGDAIELVRFEDYYGEATPVNRITIRNVPEAANRLIELETGQVDIALDIAPSDITSVAQNSDLNLLREPNLRSHYIGFNVQVEPFNDVRVRQAINHAIDVDLIISSILEGVGIRINGPLGDGWGTHPNLPEYEFNVEVALSLLAEAGFPDGFTTSILTNQDNNDRAIAEAVQSKLSDIGITATISNVENASFLELVASGYNGIFVTGWTNVTRDPDYGLTPLFHTINQGTGGNRTFYSNPEVDALLDAARSERDLDARRQLYYDVQEIIVADAPWVFLKNGEIVIATRNNVRGFRANPSGHHRFSAVYFEE